MPAQEKEQVWIFKCLIPGSSMVVKKSSREIIYDGTGTTPIDTISKGKIQIAFGSVNGLFVLNETTAHRYGMKPADMAKLIMAKPEFGRKVFCIQSPEKTLTKGEIEEVQKQLEAKDKTGPKMVQGVRGRG